MPPVRRSGSPHPGWTLPPRVGRQVHLCHGMPHGAVEESKVRKLPTPSRYRSPTLSQSVRGSCHTPAAVSRWSKICLIDRPRQCVCKHRHDRIPNVSKLPAPSRHRALTPSQTARASRRSPITTTRATFACRNQLRSHIRNGNPLFSGWATLSTPASGASTDAGRHALGPEHTPFREHRLRCVRCTCMRP